MLDTRTQRKPTGSSPIEGYRVGRALPSLVITRQTWLTRVRIRMVHLVGDMVDAGEPLVELAGNGDLLVLGPVMGPRGNIDYLDFPEAQKRSAQIQAVLTQLAGILPISAAGFWLYFHPRLIRRILNIQPQARETTAVTPSPNP